LKKEVLVAGITVFTMMILLLLSSFLPNILPNSHSTNITLATTTSTDNSGLLEYLHPYLTTDTGIMVDVVAVGTGAALEQARQGLADVVMVHARSLEDQFLEEDFGVHRVDLMFNDFIIVGPMEDPVNINGMTNNTEIFQKMYKSRDSIMFLSRGDDSGTHVKELHLWEEAGIIINRDDPNWFQQNSWYLETGSGMSDTLTIAFETSAYTLTDRGTWLFTKNNYPDLILLAEGDPEWRNPYGTILVNPEKFDPGTIQFETAKKYVQWLISSIGQSLIDSYKINGEQLFFANFENHLSEMSPDDLDFWELTIYKRLFEKRAYLIDERRR
jgi:tungstate transport system substrate-binding protein